MPGDDLASGPGRREAPLVTVLTPTFDRAELLQDVLRSLVDQTFQGFEWLVVDDGSTDDTRARVERWARDAPFEVRYLHQPNAGKHVALNRGVAAARGQYVAVLDSDDHYLPGALETLLAHFEAIPAGEALDFANVEARAATPDGQLIGDALPVPVLDADNFTGHEAVRLVDTIGMYRTDVLRAHPFPEDLGGFVPEALVWNRIARRHRTRFVSDVVAVKRYQAAGLSARSDATRISEALAYRTFYRELVALPHPMSISTRLRGYAGYIRCCLHLREGLLAQVRAAPSLGWWLVALPLGLLTWARDRVRLRREPPQPARGDRVQEGAAAPR